MGKGKKEEKELISNMSEKKKSQLLLALIILSCIVVGIVAGWWALNSEPSISLFASRSIPDEYPANFPNLVEDYEFYYVSKTVISSVNIVLVSALLAIYLTLYKANKSNFVFGLIVFALVLLFYALVSNPIVISIFGFRAFGLGPFAVLPDLFTTIALSILLYLTFK